MKQFFAITALFLSINTSFSQAFTTPIDTIVTKAGTVLLYQDRTWDYIEESSISQNINDINKKINLDSSLYKNDDWKNNVVLSYKNDNAKTMKDTLWMCVLDSSHNKFAIPIDGIVTSKFGIRHGRNHNGTDLDLETGDIVYSAFDGIVRYAQAHSGGFGNLVIIRHYNGLETFYAHLSELLVVPNEKIKAGEAIGLGGNTGRSTGSHLHFEVRYNGQAIDPELIFDFKKKIVKDDNLFVHKDIFSNSKSKSKSSNYSKGGKKYHRIRSGDTLGAIARRNHTSVSKLCKLNGIRPTTILHIGKSIRVS